MPLIFYGGGWGYWDGGHHWHGAPDGVWHNLNQRSPGRRRLPPGWRRPVPPGRPSWAARPARPGGTTRVASGGPPQAADSLAAAPATAPGRQPPVIRAASGAKLTDCQRHLHSTAKPPLQNRDSGRVHRAAAAFAGAPAMLLVARGCGFSGDGAAAAADHGPAVSPAERGRACRRARCRRSPIRPADPDTAPPTSRRHLNRSPRLSLSFRTLTIRPAMSGAIGTASAASIGLRPMVRPGTFTPTIVCRDTRSTCQISHRVPFSLDPCASRERGVVR